MINDLKPIIAKNIADLRRANDITQADLAEKLNYSDKAVSKWERGESIPDVTVLKNIAGIFGVTVDYLLTEENIHPQELLETEVKQKNYNHIIITAMCMFLVILISTFIYVVLTMAMGMRVWHLLSFAYAVPICAIMMIIFNSVWFNPRYNFFYISILVWSFIAVLILSFLACGTNILPLAIVGIPGQIIIIMWSRLKFTSKNIVYKFKNRKNKED